MIPVLAYDDVAKASERLCRALILIRGTNARGAVLVRVADADAYHEQAKQSGARILEPPTDVDPASWGGLLR